MKKEFSFPISLKLEGEIAEAFDNYCGDTLDSRANATRKLIVAALRQANYLPALDAPRRHRGPRRSEAA